MGRTKLWDAQFRFNWLSSWIDRLKTVAEISGEDSAAVARRAIEREIEKHEKKLGIAVKTEK